MILMCDNLGPRSRCSSSPGCNIAGFQPWNYDWSGSIYVVAAEVRRRRGNRPENESASLRRRLPFFGNRSRNGFIRFGWTSDAPLHSDVSAREDARPTS